MYKKRFSEKKKIRLLRPKRHEKKRQKKKKIEMPSISPESPLSLRRPQTLNHANRKKKKKGKRKVKPNLSKHRQLQF